MRKENVRTLCAKAEKLEKGGLWRSALITFCKAYAINPDNDLVKLLGWSHIARPDGVTWYEYAEAEREAIADAQRLSGKMPIYISENRQGEFILMYGASEASGNKPIFATSSNGRIYDYRRVDADTDGYMEYRGERYNIWNMEPVFTL